jgi:hypothetical protein
MRSKKLDLDGVAAQFKAWRRTKTHRQPIPAELLGAAVRLLDRHSVTAICRRLRLNHQRFNQAREGLLGIPTVDRVASRRASRRPSSVMAAKSAANVTRMAPGGGAFVELPPLQRSLGGLLPPVAPGVPREAARYRLVLESASGTLTLVTTSPGRGLSEAVRRFVLGALDGSSEA